jgi:hypothetical protein
MLHVKLLSRIRPVLSAGWGARDGSKAEAKYKAVLIYLTVRSWGKEKTADAFRIVYSTFSAALDG